MPGFQEVTYAPNLAIGLGDFETPSDILKVWQTREPIRRLTPNEFNADLGLLLESHC